MDNNWNNSNNQNQQQPINNSNQPQQGYYYGTQQTYDTNNTQGQFNGQTGQNYYQFSQGQQGFTQNNMNNNMNHPDFVLYLVLSIIEVFCCSPLAGIIALIFVILGNSDYKRADTVNAQQKFKIAKIILIVGVVLALICTCSSVVFGFAGEILDAISG
jgi:hypothetical protein